MYKEEKVTIRLKLKTEKMDVVGQNKIKRTTRNEVGSHTHTHMEREREQ